MISCKGVCEEWFHGKCAGLRSGDGDRIDTYVCHYCTKPGFCTTWKRTVFKGLEQDDELESASDVSAVYNVRDQAEDDTCCYCLKSGKEGGWMLTCSGCSGLMHGKCANITKAVFRSITKFMCSECTETGSTTTYKPPRNKPTLDAAKPSSLISSNATLNNYGPAGPPLSNAQLLQKLLSPLNLEPAIRDSLQLSAHNCSEIDADDAGAITNTIDNGCTCFLCGEQEHGEIMIPCSTMCGRLFHGDCVGPEWIEGYICRDCTKSRLKQRRGAKKAAKSLALWATGAADGGYMCVPRSA